MSKKIAIKKRKPSKAVAKAKKFAPQKKTKRAARAFTFMCNQWQDAGKFYTYRNGMAGTPNYGCGTIPSRIKKSDVAKVDTAGTCVNEETLYKITLT